MKKIIKLTTKKIVTPVQLYPTLEILKSKIEVKINESKNMKEIAALRKIDIAVNSLIKQVLQYNKM